MSSANTLDMLDTADFLEKLQEERYVASQIRMADELGLSFTLATEDGRTIVVWGDDAHTVAVLDGIAQDDYYRSR